jgi:hypothetical protein
MCSHYARIECQSDQYAFIIRFKSIDESWNGTDQKCEESPYPAEITNANVDNGNCGATGSSSPPANYDHNEKTCKSSDSVIWTWKEAKDKAYLTAPEYENKEVTCIFHQGGIGSNY